MQADYQDNLTSSGIGECAELAVTGGLMLASRGRLAPFRPVIDDAGIDLLLYNRLTGNTVPLQIKSRTGLDGQAAQTVQFDVRQSTFRPDTGGYLLAILMRSWEIDTMWLVPMARLRGIARSRSDKLVMVASANPASGDRFSPYRCRKMTEVVERLMNTRREDRHHDQ